MKETRIKQIRLELGKGRGDDWIIATTTQEESLIPGEIRGLFPVLGKWAAGMGPDGNSLVLIHKGRWSIVAIGASNRVRILALARADFASHFAADPFRVGPILGNSLQFESQMEKTWLIDPELGALPPIAYFQDLLKSSDSALLLGGAQALMDGARVQLDAGIEDGELARKLWSLIPIPVRLERTVVVGDPGDGWVADLIALQPTTRADAWISQKLGDYPEGRYEFGIHSAIDQGDEAAVHKFLHRQSPRQVMFMATFLLVGMVIIGILMGW